MIQLKHNGTGSWLDPRSSRGLAAHLSARLWERCRGHRGLVLTLTYRRDRYRDAQDLYHTQRIEQHVPLFMRKIGRHLGEKLTGRWFCKMEFQRGGWVHFHVIILDVPRIPHADLSCMWGHGYLSVKRLTPRAVKYCTKYLAKDDGIPAWLYGERSRSVKIVRVSPGFWGTTPEPPPPDEEPDPYQEPQATRVNAWVPIGTKIEQRWNRFTARDEEGHYVHGDCDLGPTLLALLIAGCGIVGRDGGWLVIDATLDDLRDATATAAKLAAPRPSAKRAGAVGDKPPIDLIQPSNPDADSWRHYPAWLKRWFAEPMEVGAA